MSNYKVGIRKYVKSLIAFFIGLTISGLLADIMSVWSIVPGIVGGYGIYRVFPDSGAESASQRLNELPKREKIERKRREINSNDPEREAEQLSFVEPSDVVDAISILELDAHDLPVDQLNHIAMVIRTGVQLPQDRQQVLAQLHRVSDRENITGLLYQRLFDLFDAAEFGIFSGAAHTAKIRAIQSASENRGAVAATLTFIPGVNAGGARKVASNLEEVEDEEIAGKDVVTRTASMGVIGDFSRLVAPPREYHPQLISIINSKEDNGSIRGSAAVALGGIGRAHPDLSERVTNEIKPLLNHESRECRLGAVEALAGPARHHHAGKEALEAIVRGENQEFAFDTALREKAQEILNGNDPYSYQSASSSEQSDEEPDDNDEFTI